jgi:integrase
MTIKVELHKRNVKLPSGGKAQYWTLRWWGTDGRRFSESVGRVGEVTKSEAETARREKEQAIGGGKIKRNRPKEVTLAEYIELDRETIRGTVKLNTIESVKHSAAHATKAWGGSTKLTSIGRGHVGRLKAYLLDEAKVAETTIAKTLRTLKAMLNRALKDGLIHENPLAGVRMPKSQSRPKRIYSPDETRAMRAVASTLWWQAFIALAETSGLRKGELVNLHWRDVDFENKTVRVSAKRAGEFTVKGRGLFPLLLWSPKSYEERTLPLPESTIRVLAKFQSESDGSPYVFLSLDRLAKIDAEIKRKGKLGANYEPINNMKARFDLIQGKARKLLADERGVAIDDVSWAHGTVHDLRRTYGTRMSRVVPMHVLKEYMGHAKITTTQEYYLAAETQDADRARAAMEALADPNRTSSSGRNQDAIAQNTGAESRTHQNQKHRKPRNSRGFLKRGGRDSNPQPPDRQSGTLTN